MLKSFKAENRQAFNLGCERELINFKKWIVITLKVLFNSERQDFLGILGTFEFRSSVNVLSWKKKYDFNFSSIILKTR